MALKLERVSPSSGAYPENTVFKSDIVAGEHVPVIQLYPSTGNKSPITIDEAHARIHSGDSYHISLVQSVASLATMDILYIVPDSNKLPHLTIGYESQGEIQYDVYRSPTVTNNGTQLDIFNRDENSPNTSGIVAYHSPTVSVSGAVRIFQWQAGAGKTTATTERGTLERIQRRNTTYLFRIINLSNQTNVCSMRLDWYEQEYL